MLNGEVSRVTDLFRETKKNPFRILNATPSDSRESLIEKQREMELFGEKKEGEQALSALLYPQSRLEAEIHWFPNTANEEINRLLAYVSNPQGFQPVPQFRTDSFLARFNALKLQLMIFPVSETKDLVALIHSLSTVADALLPGQVTEEINRDREKAGFSLLQKAGELDAQLTGLLRETVRAYLEAFSARTDRMELKRFGELLRTEMKNRKSPYHNSFLLDLSSEEFSLQSSKDP